MRRADVVYAPSHHLAEYFKTVHNINVCVVRPPTHDTLARPLPLPFPLPPRFFVHFGMLIERKGSDVLAEALPLAWKMVPELTMVWSGLCFDNSKIQKWRLLWGDQASHVLITGPLPRPEIYAVLQKADAAVLPSLVDNLPNTVIESLSFGIPVIGTRGASIDELVEEGVTGHLVERSDPSALAQALVKMWRKETSVEKGFRWNSSITNEMKPDVAVARLVELCERRKSFTKGDQKH
jgi:glycogen(starch) synthase